MLVYSCLRLANSAVDHSWGIASDHAFLYLLLSMLPSKLLLLCSLPMLSKNMLLPRERYKPYSNLTSVPMLYRHFLIDGRLQQSITTLMYSISMVSSKIRGRLLKLLFYTVFKNIVGLENQCPNSLLLSFLLLFSGNATQDDARGPESHGSVAPWPAYLCPYWV